MTLSSSLDQRILLFVNIILIGFITISCGALSSDSSSAVDVSIADIEAPTSATQGQTVNVDVILENTSEENISESITVTLENQTEEISINSQTVTNLAAADTALLTFTWNTEEATPAEYILQASHDLEDDNATNNSRTASVTITEQEESDIAISEINSPSSVTQGNEVDIEVTLENTGNQHIDEEINITLEDNTDGVAIETQTVNSLEAGATTTLTYTWNTGDASTGDHELTASHSFEDDNGDNNAATATVTINEPAVNDIAITETNAPSSAEQGDEIDIEVTVENSGNQSIDENFEVTLEDNTDGVTIGTQTVSGLETGATTTLTYTWNTGDASTGDHELTASHAVDDDNSSNNSETTTVTINEPTVTDIAITETNAPSSAEQGDEIDINVTVENSGNQSIDENFEVTLEDNTDGVTIGTQTVSGLETGATTTLTYTWNTGDASTGDHELTASHAVDDDNSSNNSETTTVTINEPAVTDIAITETNAPSSVTQGDTAHIEVTLENIRETDVSETITVTFMHHQETLGTRTIEGGLNAGSSETVTLGWDTTDEGTGPPPHPIDIFHDVEDDDESNNEVTVEILVEEPDN